MPMSRASCLLVVEDEALLRMLLETVLEDTEYNFRVLTSPGAAIDALEAEGGGFDVLITNINLGENVSGFDIARRARELNPDIQVIYMSGDAGYRFEAEKVPGAMFLAKPFEPDALLDILHRRLTPTTGVASVVDPAHRI